MSNIESDPERFQGFHGTPLSAKTHHILPRWLMQLKHMQGGEEGGGGGGGEEDAPANSHVDFIGQQSEGCSHRPLIPEGLVSMLLLFYARVLPPFNIPICRVVFNIPSCTDSLYTYHVPAGIQYFNLV